MKLRKGIISVICANIVNLFISMGNGFLLPKYLSIDTYAGLKIFLLYISYIGVLHLGYIDGVYIKYGGKTRNKIDSNEIKRDKKTFVIFQLIVAIFVLLISIILRNVYLFLFSINILPANMVTFYKFIYQAIGEFNSYSHITNIIPISCFILNFILLLVVKSDKLLYYEIIPIVVNLFVWIYYEYKNNWELFDRDIDINLFLRIKKNISIGVIIMLGNFMGIWIANIDRWFVNFFCDIEDFAFYSFAVTMLKLLNVIVTAFSITLYNYFCSTYNLDNVIKMRKYVLIIAAALLVIFFPLNFVILIYLPKYREAILIIKWLFASQFIMVEINAVYMNLYKALNQQRKYLIQMMIVLLIAVLTNIFFGTISDYEIISFAGATFFTSLIWLILCQIGLQKYNLSINEWIYLILVVVIYFFLGQFNFLVGMFLYVILFILITFVFFRKEIRNSRKFFSHTS